jgi:hypothetical protein
MENKDSITVIFYDKAEAEDQSKNALPGYAQIRGRIVEIKKGLLAASLNSLVSDIHEIIKQLPTTSDKSELDTISVSVQVGAEGGAALVVSANANVSSGMTLTIKLKKNKK